MLNALKQIKRSVPYTARIMMLSRKRIVVGERSKIEPGVIWWKYDEATIQIGSDSIIETACRIRADECGSVTVGNRVTLRQGVTLKSSGTLNIDDDVYVNTYCHIACAGTINIASKVMIGPGVVIVDSDHDYSDPGVAMRDAPLLPGNIAIGYGVWIAANVTITRNVTIGDHALIAAGAVVTRDIPAGAICGGVPAAIIRYREGFHPV